MINVPKGTKDVLPQDSYKWQFVEQKARETAKVFGASEIRTPTFEHTEVFLRGVGETTDIVNKEMYTFNDKGGRSITLKPEGTAGVARAFVENGLSNSVLPAKLFYITQCFRYERPQAGRLREFHQFGVEFLGAKNADIDAEVILLAKTFLESVGIENVVLYINSIGCKECRKNYETALKEYLNKNYDSLCSLCKDRLNKNPLRILDCKNDECKKITENAPKILDYICEDCSAHLETVKTLLDKAGVLYKINPNIVRGLDYYTSLEGSLKLKEISYIHSEAAQFGELKHGSIALIEEGTPAIAIATDKKMLDKTVSNIKEIKARGADVMAVTTIKDFPEDIVDEIIYLPEVNEIFSPLVSSIPLQLIAYHVTVEKGLDVDKPRNLAKSVTVE